MLGGWACLPHQTCAGIPTSYQLRLLRYEHRHRLVQQKPPAISPSWVSCLPASHYNSIPLTQREGTYLARRNHTLGIVGQHWRHAFVPSTVTGGCWDIPSHTSSLLPCYYLITCCIPTPHLPHALICHLQAFCTAPPALTRGTCCKTRRFAQAATRQPFLCMCALHKGLEKGTYNISNAGVPTLRGLTGCSLRTASFRTVCTHSNMVLTRFHNTSASHHRRRATTHNSARSLV